jgi:hypothetical protein
MSFAIFLSSAAGVITGAKRPAAARRGVDDKKNLAAIIRKAPLAAAGIHYRKIID